MLYFWTHEQAETFAALNSKYELIDCGSDAPHNRRWAVKVIFKKNAPKSST